MALLPFTINSQTFSRWFFPNPKDNGQGFPPLSPSVRERNQPTRAWIGGLTLLGLAELSVFGLAREVKTAEADPSK
jgi:hypothetical protein